MCLQAQSVLPHRGVRQQKPAQVSMKKMKCALHYFNQSAVTAIADHIPGTSCNADADVDDSGEEQDLPAPKEICALILADAQPRSPGIFLAKVLRCSADGQSVCLAWLKGIKGKLNHYKFQASHSV